MFSHDSTCRQMSAIAVNFAICRWHIGHTLQTLLPNSLEDADMKVVKMKLADLVKPEKNVRIHTEQQIKEFCRSVEMFGQIRPIVVDEKNVILAGNGLYDTLIAMGKDTADVYRYDNLTENQKKKLMIADNKIFSLGIENLETLNSFLEDLQGDLDIPGFDEEILKQMVSEAEDITSKLSEYGTLDECEIRSIKEAAEKRKQQMEKTEGGQGEQQMEPDPVAVQQESAADNEDSTEIRKFVVCTKCGEKIWL